MALSSALAQEGFSIVSSYISAKLDEKASKAHTIARLEMALSRLEFVLERTGTLPITYASLLRRRRMLKIAYIHGRDLLSKHTQQQVLELEGKQEIGPQLVTGSSYLEQVASVANLSVFSLFGLSKEHLSSSVVQTFEWYADCGDKFAADVESGCPLRRGIFPCPFARKLFEGKTLRYERMEGSQMLSFSIRPVILEGRGVEAYLRYKNSNPERLDKSFSLGLMLRLSEGTDLVGTAIHCLQSSAALLDLVAEDAIGELALLHDLQASSHPCAPPWVGIQQWHTENSQFWRSDPLCCHGNGHSTTISSELTHIFPEEVIIFGFESYIPALEYRLPSASREEARGGNAVVDWPRPQPLSLTLVLAPHLSLPYTPEENCVFEVMGDTKEERTHGNIQETVDTVRSEAIDCLIHQPQVMNCAVYWFSKHGYAQFTLEKPSADMATAAPKACSRGMTRSDTKRKR